MNERSFIVKSESHLELNSVCRLSFFSASLPGGRIELPTKGL